MGTEIVLSLTLLRFRFYYVKLNNPLMGTEILLKGDITWYTEQTC